jgi:hypothetical protein
MLLVPLLVLGATTAAAGGPAGAGHAVKLTPATFDDWVHAAIKGEQTAFVRWTEKSASATDCSWIGRGFMWGLDDGDHIEAAGEHAGDPVHDGEPIHADGGDDDLHPDHPHSKLTNHLKKDPCVVVRQQDAAWKALTNRYAGNPSVVFGDVVVSDWPDEVKKVKKHFIPPLPHSDHQMEEGLFLDEEVHEADLASNTEHMEEEPEPEPEPDPEAEEHADSEHDGPEHDVPGEEEDNLPIVPGPGELTPCELGVPHDLHAPLPVRCARVYACRSLPGQLCAYGYLSLHDPLCMHMA